MESITKIIVNLERSVNDLQRDNDGMKQALLNVSTNVEALTRKVNSQYVRRDVSNENRFNSYSMISQTIWGGFTKWLITN